MTLIRLSERAKRADRPFPPQMISKPVISTRNSTPATGNVQVKLGFVSSPNTAALMDFEEIYSELVKRTRRSLVSAPPVRSSPSP